MTEPRNPELRARQARSRARRALCRGRRIPRRVARSESFWSSGCDECAALAADIRLISTRTTQLPAVARTRDFRITPDQAQQLRGSWIDRVMRAPSPHPAGRRLARSPAPRSRLGSRWSSIGALPFGNLGTERELGRGAQLRLPGSRRSLLAAEHRNIRRRPSLQRRSRSTTAAGGAPGSAPAASGAPEKNDGGASVPTVGDANVEPTMPRDMSSQGSGVPQPSSATSVAPAAGATTAGAQSPESSLRQPRRARLRLLSSSPLQRLRRLRPSASRARTQSARPRRVRSIVRC